MSLNDVIEQLPNSRLHLKMENFLLLFFSSLIKISQALTLTGTEDGASELIVEWDTRRWRD